MIHRIFHFLFPLPRTLFPSFLHIADSFTLFKVTSSEKPFLTISPKVAPFQSYKCCYPVCFLQSHYHNLTDISFYIIRLPLFN